MIRLPLSALLLASATPVCAETPQVVTDTGVMHALVSRVMAGVGDPARLLPPGASPHDFQLRPSDASVLSDAQVVIWMGEGLTPWLADPLATLAPGAHTLEILDTDGWTTLPIRTDPAFAVEDEHGHGDEHAEEDGDEHADAHGDEHADAHGDEHAAFDPHAWLDPTIAAVWLGLIAETLAVTDPANAAAYEANAAAGQAEFAALDAEIAALLAPVAGEAYVVAHDALQYLEARYAMPATGAIALTDATAPGPARIAELQELFAAGAVTCVLTDTETSPDWAVLLSDGLSVGMAQVDPEGTTLPPGPDLYPALMRNMATALRDCLSDQD
jgi:zinc transport system substrate-binding protein